VFGIATGFNELVSAYLFAIEAHDAYVRLEYRNPNEVAYESVAGDAVLLQRVGDSLGLEITDSIKAVKIVPAIPKKKTKTKRSSFSSKVHERKST